MTDETFRRRVLACVGAGIAVGVAGCSGGGGETTEDDEPEDSDETATGEPGTAETTEDSGMVEATEEPVDDTTSSDGRALTLNVLGNEAYQTERVTIESLTFVAAEAGDDSATIEVGQTVDISDGTSREPPTITEDLTVPYGTYESVEMTVTPGEIRDEEGAAVDVSGGTVSQSFTEIDDEPNTVEESGFDATLTLYLDIRNGQFEVTGYSAVGL